MAESVRAAPRRKLALFFDGNCQFCTRAARFLRAVDVFRTIDVLDMRQTNLTEARLDPMELDKSVTAVSRSGEITRGFAALALISRGIPLLMPIWLLGHVPPLAALGERLYRWLDERWRCTPCRQARSNH